LISSSHSNWGIPLKAGQDSQGFSDLVYFCLVNATLSDSERSVFVAEEFLAAIFMTDERYCVTLLTFHKSDVGVDLAAFHAIIGAGRLIDCLVTSIDEVFDVVLSAGIGEAPIEGEVAEGCEFVSCHTFNR